MPDSTSTKILGPMELGDIISRAWRLYRHSFIRVIIYSLIPGVCWTFSDVLINCANIYFLQTYGNGLKHTILTSLILIVLYFACFFISLFFNFSLMKAFYNNITGKIFDYKTILRDTSQNIIKIIRFSAVLALEVVVFVILDFLIIIVFFFLSYAITGIPFIVKEILIAILMILFIVIYILIIPVQALVCFLQLMLLAAGERSVLTVVPQSQEFVGTKYFKSIFFGISFFLLWNILLSFFNIPVLLIIYYLNTILTADQLYITMALTSIWDGIVSLIIWPFAIASIVLFFYDAKSRKEGLDLKLALQT